MPVSANMFSDVSIIHIFTVLWWCNQHLLILWHNLLHFVLWDSRKCGFLSLKALKLKLYRAIPFLSALGYWLTKKRVFFGQDWHTSLRYISKYFGCDPLTFGYLHFQSFPSAGILWFLNLLLCFLANSLAAARRSLLYGAVSESRTDPSQSQMKDRRPLCYQ